MEKHEVKILAIDDLKDNLISLKALIREAFPDAMILSAENGVGGLALAQSEDPDVILLDVVMPGMDGFEVCQKLKSNPKTLDIPVVFLTALKGDPEGRILALEVGAEAFLAKPIDETELTAQIRAMQKIKTANNRKRQEKEILAQRVAEQTCELERAHAATLILLENLRKENESRKENEIALQNSQKALFESESFARATVDALSVHLAILDENGTIITVNHAWRAFAQANSGDMANLCEGVNYLTVCDGVRGPESETAIAFSAGIHAVQRMELDEFTLEYACHSPKEKRWFIGRVTRFNDTDSHKLVVAHENITGRKLAEEELRSSEARFRSLFEQAAVGMAIIETKTNGFIDVNQKYCEFLGFSREEMLSMTFIDVTHPDDMPVYMENNSQMLAGKISEFSMEARYFRKDGNLVWGDLTTSQMWNPGETPQVYYHIAIVQNITERKLAEQALHNSNKKYQILFETLSEGVALNEVIYDDDGEMVDYRILEVNPAFYNLADYTGPVLGNVATKLYGMTPDFIKAFWRQHTHKKTVQTVEMTSPLQGRTYLIATSPFENDRFVTSFVEITGRKKAEIALRDSELALNKAQQVAHVGSWTWYISQDRLEWSDEMYRIFGMDKAGFTGKLSEVILNAIHPEDRAAVEQANNSVIQEKKPIPLEYRIIRPDGTIRVVWAEAGEMIQDEAGNPLSLTGIAQDITERKLADQKINEQLSELRRWYSAMLGREKRTIELKDEVNELLAKAGQPPRYAGSLEVTRADRSA